MCQLLDTSFIEGFTVELGHVLYMDEDVATIMNQHTCDILCLYDALIYKVCNYSMFHKHCNYRFLVQ